jgi:hypothetical protein
MKGKDDGLAVALVDGRLVISIGVNTLAHATAYADDPVKIVDPDLAAEEIVRELTREEEDGTTPVHKLLDKAVFDAWENGGEGFAYLDDDDADEPVAPPTAPAVGDAG